MPADVATAEGAPGEGEEKGEEEEKGVEEEGGPGPDDGE
jgi:hypothetical protein